MNDDTKCLVGGLIMIVLLLWRAGIFFICVLMAMLIDSSVAIGRRSASIDLRCAGDSLSEKLGGMRAATFLWRLSSSNETTNKPSRFFALPFHSLGGDVMVENGKNCGARGPKIEKFHRLRRVGQLATGAERRSGPHLWFRTNDESCGYQSFCCRRRKGHNGNCISTGGSVATAAA
jgi:hypothetical protein